MKHLKNRIVHILICLSLALSMAAPVFAAGGSNYSYSEIELLARVIQHEAGGECLEGRIAVGNVILNRVQDYRFPNTISGVVYQKNQFADATRAVPDATSWKAAQMAIAGNNVVPGAYWFNGVRASAFTFAKKLYVIGGHAFYGFKY